MTTNKLDFSIGIPNIMTICRILITPMFVILLLKRHFFVALFIFTIAGISDGLDGFIARYFNQKTILGGYLDPLADKLLLISAFICLSILQVVPLYFTIIIVLRDFLIIIGIIILSFKRKSFEINPSLLSKFNTIIQIVTVFESLLILLNHDLNDFHFILCWASIALTLLSGLQYIHRWFNVLHKVDQFFGLNR